MLLSEYSGYTKKTLLRELTLGQAISFVGAIQRRRNIERATYASLTQAAVAGAQDKKALRGFKRMIDSLLGPMRRKAGRPITAKSLKRMHIIDEDKVNGGD